MHLNVHGSGIIPSFENNLPQKSLSELKLKRNKKKTHLKLNAQLRGRLYHSCYFRVLFTIAFLPTADYSFFSLEESTIERWPFLSLKPRAKQQQLTLWQEAHELQSIKTHKLDQLFFVLDLQKEGIAGCVTLCVTQPSPTYVPKHSTVHCPHSSEQIVFWGHSEKANLSGGKVV